MDDAPATPAVIRFGEFELDLRTAQLRAAGVLTRLQPQPAKVLALLASNCGNLVSREQIRQQIWGAATFVDFEQGLNFCIRQIRTALDRKSTRLNSSHLVISYAVFCLKKKKKTHYPYYSKKKKNKKEK